MPVTAAPTVGAVPVPYISSITHPSDTVFCHTLPAPVNITVPVPIGVMDPANPAMIKLDVLLVGLAVGCVFEDAPPPVPALTVHVDPRVQTTPFTVVPVLTRSALVMSPVAVNEPVTTSPEMVPRLVREELTTFEASVVPVSVPAGAITALPPAAVIKPLPLTVKFGIDVDDPKLPVLVFTVARVVAQEDDVISPVSAGSWPHAAEPAMLENAICDPAIW